MATTPRELDTTFISYCIEQYFNGSVSANEAMGAIRTVMKHDGQLTSATECPEENGNEQPALKAGYQFFKTGYTSILVPDEDADDFADGFSNGWVDYPPKDRLLTSDDIRRIILETFIDPGNSATWNTAYIMGAVRGIYEGGYYSNAPEPEIPFIQLGNVTLRLNHPLFSAGWLCGYENYGASHAQHLAPQTVTAIELLRHIAHYNPKSRQYSLDEEHASHVEETLGRIIGYFCAALSPQSTQEQDTEPLQVAALQEA